MIRHKNEIRVFFHHIIMTKPFNFAFFFCSITSINSCAATRKLFNELGIVAKIIELDVVDDGAAIQDALAELTGQRSVPNVFIKGNHVGGNDKTQEAHKNGDLQRLLSS
jgi:glutaredoxin